MPLNAILMGGAKLPLTETLTTALPAARIANHITNLFKTLGIYMPYALSIMSFLLPAATMRWMARHQIHVGPSLKSLASFDVQHPNCAACLLPLRK